MLNEIKNSLADGFSLPVTEVEFENNEFYIKNSDMSLDVKNCFYPQKTDVEILNEIQSYRVVASTDISVSVENNTSGEKFSIFKIDNKNVDLQHGIYIIPCGGGTAVNYHIFTGSLVGAGPLDLSMMPCILFGLLLISPGAFVARATAKTWYDVYNAIGPFVVCNNEEPNLIRIARYGFFKTVSSTQLPYKNNYYDNDVYNNSAVAKVIKTDISAKVYNAYEYALRVRASTDLVYLSYHRVFEVLFAWGLKKYISNHINEEYIYETIKTHKNLTNESEMTRYLVVLSKKRLPTTISPNDLLVLFNVTKVDDITKHHLVAKWTAGRTPLTVEEEHDVLAEILYQVRCGLVHSKISTKSIYIMGPYSRAQEQVLCALIDIQKEIIESLIYS
ncbi:hypothetical protein ACUVJH_20965 [Aeromonas veronii]|uniref:hypothetical protein n=1 Tax=Aeromonas veronii TaxID=654 RepID=UPI0040554929